VSRSDGWSEATAPPSYITNNLPLFISLFADSAFPLNNREMRALMKAVLVFEKLEPIGDIPQTKCTMVSSLNLRGQVPKVSGRE